MRIRDRFRERDMEFHEAVSETLHVNMIGVLSKFIATHITLEELNDLATGGWVKDRFVELSAYKPAEPIKPKELPNIKPRKRYNSSKRAVPEMTSGCPHCSGKKTVQK